LDGAGEIRTMVNIVLPMSMPIIATFVIMEFTNKWNEYLWPRIVLQDFSKYVLQLKLMAFSATSASATAGDRQAILKSAATIIITIPIIVVYVSCQKYFLRSMNLSGLK
jgi:multiple sugar transport system permease protein